MQFCKNCNWKNSFSILFGSNFKNEHQIKKIKIIDLFEICFPKYFFRPAQIFPATKNVIQNSEFCIPLTVLRIHMYHSKNNVFSRYTVSITLFPTCSYTFNWGGVNFPVKKSKEESNFFSLSFFIK